MLSSSIFERNELLLPSLRRIEPKAIATIMICKVFPVTRGASILAGMASSNKLKTPAIPTPVAVALSKDGEKNQTPQRTVNIVTRNISVMKRVTRLFPIRPRVTTSPMLKMPQITEKKISGPTIADKARKKVLKMGATKPSANGCTKPEIGRAHV